MLRHQLGLIGTRVGCGEGGCGACTVLVDSEPHISYGYGTRIVWLDADADSGAVDVLHPHAATRLSATPERARRALEGA